MHGHSEVHSAMFSEGLAAALVVIVGTSAACGCERSSLAASPLPAGSARAAELSTAASDANRSPGPLCVRDETFPSPWRVPEASAAAEVELRPGLREILVVGDSGRHGAAMAWSRSGGMRPLTLPLDAVASDDLEGMAWLSEPSGPHLYTLTSSGAVRRFSPDGAGALRRDVDSYALGPPPLSCVDLRDGNCGKNWEGLCLRASSSQMLPGRCAGYAASKTETALYCVVFGASGRLSIDASVPAIKLPVDRLLRSQGVLSDCAFGAQGGPAEGLLLVTTNVFGGSATYLVNEGTSGDRLTPIDLATTPSNEAIAVDRSGAFYAFMDDNGATSIAVRYQCRGWPSDASKGR
jgi:hypothetical protein